MAVDRTKQPEIRKFENIHLDFPQPIKLRNGIPVWVIGNGEDEVNRLSVFIQGGTFEEKYPMQSFFTAALALEGSGNMAPEQVAEKLDFYGAWKGSTNYDHNTMVSLSSLNRSFGETLNIFNDCLLEPIFPEKQCRLYQQKLASNIATGREMVRYLANEEMHQLYYGKNHPLAQYLTPEGIMAITTDDLRSFRNQYFGANNCRVVFAGHITDKELQILDDTFGKWQFEGAYVDEKKEPAFCPSPHMLSIIDKKGALQSAVCMTIQAIPRRHPDYFKLRLAIKALGGYFGSRLNSNIREDKGYTYGIGAYLSGRHNDSFVSVQTECATKYTWPLIEEVKKEMVKLKTELMTIEELNTVKQYMLSEAAKTLDTPFSKAEYVQETFYLGIYPEYFNDQIKDVLACTPEDVMEMAQKYLDIDKLRIVIAGDKEQIEKSR